MKFVLLKDFDENTIDDIFYVPDNADVEDFVKRCCRIFYSCDGSWSVSELIKQNLPVDWIFMDYWNGLETVNYSNIKGGNRLKKMAVLGYMLGLITLTYGTYLLTEDSSGAVFCFVMCIYYFRSSKRLGLLD